MNMNGSSEPSRLAVLSNQALVDSDRWFGDTGTTHNLAYMVLALCGEAGELANIVKKIERKSLNINDAETRFRLMEESTDVLVYLLIIYRLLGVDPEKAYMHVRAQNEKRFMAERAKRETKQ